ncbi:hypothetical protein [Bdellovibrio sp. BCCA]|uniref:hypothetical protein n=1 Tax=Bdellovibrio sp. BCCA TaxID=3136281 RepID=UPI0030EFEE16
MKHLVIVLSLLVSTSAFAKNQDIEKRIRYAADLLASVAEGSQEFKVTPGSDVKKILFELATNEGMVDDQKDFDDHWEATPKNAWGVDEMLWAEEDRGGAYSYIESGLENTLEGSEQTDQDKIKFADGTLKLNKAFNVLRSIKSVKYGVAPMGAVQCGVTFPSLMILDTENGVVHQIIMEGSGC